MQDCVNQRKAFYLKVLLDINFSQFECPGMYISKSHQVETKPFFKYTFFHEDISQYNSFENSNDYQSKFDGIIYDQ